MAAPRLIVFLCSLALTLQLFAAEEAPVTSPKVLVIGKNGLSTNMESYLQAKTNELNLAASTNIAADAEATLSSTNEVDATEATTPPPPPMIVQPAVDWKPLVSAMEMMIEQQKMSMVAMEKTRAEAMLSAQEANRAMQEKMESMEQALADQREHEAESIARMNRNVVGVAAGFAGTGFVVMIFTAWFFMRTMSKVSEINANLQTQLLALPQIQQPLVGDGSGASNPSSQRLIGALEQLEKRIRDLEHTSDDGTDAGSPGSVDADVISESKHGEVDGSESHAATTDEADTGEDSVATLLAKGQTLLNLDQPEQALACFHRAVERDPRNADGLLKKGTALERLRRMQEAIDAYDLAIAADDKMTMAYLAKGGLCNRMERYSEALECYEKALQSQQHAEHLATSA